jgi:hypothetical protein
MQLNIHPNERVQYTSQLQYMVQNHDKDGVRTSIIFNQS